MASTLGVNRITDTDSTAYNLVLQVAHLQSYTSATGTTTTPADNTIPQISEGNLFMTQAFTPRSALNKLKITVHVNSAMSAAGTQTVALFADSGANALAAQGATTAAAGECQSISFIHYMTAGTTSTISFTVRIGGSTASTITFNGSASTQRYGGVCASSITIEEIQI